MDIPNTDSVNYAFASAQSQAMQYRHEFITPEHLSVSYTHLRAHET